MQGIQTGDDAVESKVFSVYEYDPRVGIKYAVPTRPGWQHADFTMNELLYDSRYALLIDPSGKGVEDAVRRRLRIPWSTEAQWTVWLHRMGRYEGFGRWYKFRCRGFVAAEKRQRAWMWRSWWSRARTWSCGMRWGQH